MKLTLPIILVFLVAGLTSVAAQDKSDVTLMAADSRSFTVTWDARPEINYLVLVDENTSFLFNPRVYRVKGGIAQIPVDAIDTYVVKISREDTGQSILGKDGYIRIERADFASAGNKALSVRTLTEKDRKVISRVLGLPAPQELPHPNVAADNPRPTVAKIDELPVSSGSVELPKQLTTETWKPSLRDLRIAPSTVDGVSTFDYRFVIDLPASSRPVVGGSNLLVRPSVGEHQFTGAAVRFVGHEKSYQFSLNLREDGQPITREKIAALQAVDFTVLVEGNRSGPPDQDALSAKLLNVITGINSVATLTRPSLGPSVRLELATQTQGTVKITNGGVYNLGTWSSGQLFQGNYFEVFNDGDSPLQLISQKNGKYLGVTGDAMLSSYNVGDDGKTPIRPGFELGRNGGRRLGLSIGDFKSKPGKSHSAVMTLLTNDSKVPELKFTLTFDLQAPGPRLKILYSREHFNDTLVPTWTPVAGATGYRLVRAPLGSTEPYITIYEGPALSFEDSGLTQFGTYPEVHYFVRALLSGGKATAWSWEGWSRLVDTTYYDSYDYSGTYNFDGEPEGAVHLSVGEKQEHNFFPLEDNDWLWFEAKKGVTYQVRVLPRDQGMTLKFHLDAGATPGTLNGPYYEASLSKPAVLTWKATAAGKVFVRLRGRAEMSSINPWYTVELSEKR